MDSVRQYLVSTSYGVAWSNASGPDRPAARINLALCLRPITMPSRYGACHTLCMPKTPQNISVNTVNMLPESFRHEERENLVDGFRPLVTT